MKVKPTNESGRVLVELDRRDEALLEKAAAVNRTPISQIRVKKILVPIDFSYCSKEALAFALPLARQFGAAVTILHVVHPYYAGDPSFAVNSTEYFDPDVVEHSQKQLERLAAEAASPDVPLQILVRQGHTEPSHEIIQAAKDLDADLIVISTHGYTGLKHFIMGSTAEYVVRYSTCPVLTVRAKEHQTKE